MKTELFIEIPDRRVAYSELLETIKDMWKSDGHLVKDIKNVELYFKPDERRCYYVINGDSKGYLEV